MRTPEEIVSSILKEIDKDYITYKSLYYDYHRCDDEVAKLIHEKLVNLCKRLLYEFSNGV